MSAPPPSSLTLRGADAEFRRRCLLGPLALAASVGLQTTVSALLVLGPVGDRSQLGQLTDYARGFTRPEHDLPIYLLGLVLTAVLAGVAVRLWRGRFGALPDANARPFMIRLSLTAAVFAAVSMGLCLALATATSFSSPDPDVEDNSIDWLILIRLLLPALFAVTGFLLELWRRDDGAPPWWERFQARWPHSPLILCWVVPLLLVLCVGVPPSAWARVAGRIYTVDLFHHTNFFVMGPALSFAHGRAFGAEIFSQYGIGWPLLFSCLSSVSGMTYANFVGLETTYGCIYYVGVFFLLRSLLRNGAWAAVGALLAVYWQVFSGVNPGELVWTYPSSTIMRHPVDIWFFFALLRWCRSGRLLWAALSGAACALALFFETDTGLTLLPVFVFYWLLRFARPVPGRVWRSQASALFVYSLLGAATLLPLLFLASRGQMWAPAFWRGWTEALVHYGAGGMGSLPFTELPASSLFSFVVVTGVYLAVLADALAKSFCRLLETEDAFLAAVAAYGLAALVVFVGRTHPYNLCHAAVPFAIIAAALGSRCSVAVRPWLRVPSLGLLTLCGVFLELLLLPAFLDYPNLFGPPPSGGATLSLMADPRDVSGLPPQFSKLAAQLQQVAFALKSLPEHGQGVAILDSDDATLYHAADLAPWTRYSSLFHSTFTKASVEALGARVLQERPRWVLIRGPGGDHPPEFERVWEFIYAIVAQHYLLDRSLGAYQLWRAPSK